MTDPNMAAPFEIRLRADKSTLRVAFGTSDLPVYYNLPAELLRVESPSAEVKGHGPNDARLVPGKRGVSITGIEPVGHYAVKLVFSDGHASGIYTWATLARFGQQQAQLWATYEADLAAHGLSRDVAARPVLRQRHNPPC